MTGVELAVAAAALLGIVWVNWYFFLRQQRAVAAVRNAAGVQEVAVLVQGGYEPSVVRVKRGERVRLVFERAETSSCSEEVVLPEFGVKKYLPAHEKTAVEIVPERAGSYEFMCGMAMLRGRLVVEE